MDRREFLKKSMLLTAGAMVGGSLFSEATLSAAQSGSATGKKKTIGLQLYSIGGDMGKDAAGSLKKISDMGYSAAETASYGDGKFYGRTPAEFRKMAEDVGIRVTGAHLGRGYDAGWEDWWKQACDAQAAVGGKYIVLPGIDFGKTEADLKRTCEYFDKVGAIANAAGLKFGYHNHAHEFNKQDGYVIENYLLEHTDPEKVMFELDVYWAQKGGVNPVDYIRKYAGRIPLLHIKDEQAIGESGTMDFKSIFDAAYDSGLESYFVEVERYGRTPEKDVAASYNFLAAAPYVK